MKKYLVIHLPQNPTFHLNRNHLLVFYLSTLTHSSEYYVYFSVGALREKSGKGCGKSDSARARTGDLLCVRQMR